MPVTRGSAFGPALLLRHGASMTPDIEKKRNRAVA